MKYRWLHIPSGKTGESYMDEKTMDLYEQHGFYQLINYWNSVDPGVWQYWA
jgi:hypothetical protein